MSCEVRPCVGASVMDSFVSSAPWLADRRRFCADLALMPVASSQGWRAVTKGMGAQPGDSVRLQFVCGDQPQLQVSLVRARRDQPGDAGAALVSPPAPPKSPAEAQLGVLRQASDVRNPDFASSSGMSAPPRLPDLPIAVVPDPTHAITERGVRAITQAYCDPQERC